MLRSRMESFKSWWRAPATTKDRVLGAVVGAFAGFWLGLLSLAALAPSALQPVQFVCLVIAGCALAGVLFPKAATVVLFPFGVSGGGV
jgi:hypothetical protein